MRYVIKAYVTVGLHSVDILGELESVMEICDVFLFALVHGAKMFENFITDISIQRLSA
jgi:hypothetical protein